MKDDDEEAMEEEYRTVWEQEGEKQGRAGTGGAGPSAAAPDKRPRTAAEEEDELPEDVQARLKALRGE